MGGRASGSPRETAALVVLLRTGIREAHAYAELIEEAGSATAVLRAEGLEDQQRLGAVADEIRGWQAQGIAVRTVLDSQYPANLRAVHDRPPMLFVAGRLTPSDSRSVAVIGSREASRDGVRITGSIAEHLVAADYTVVSGLAAGIDTAAHEHALRHGGRTLAVLGTGLRHAYPRTNAALQRRIAAEHAVVSQFWPDAPPSRRSFPLRNAVMSGMALGTVIVEASHASGSRIQARLALAQGRPVFLWHSLLKQEWARALARRPGVHVVRSPGEIMAALQALSPSGSLVA